MSTREETLRDLVKRYAELQDARAELDVALAGVKAELLAAVDNEPDRYQVGDVVLDVQVNRRFNEAKALDALPEELRPLVTSTVLKVDRKRLEVLAPEVFDAAWDVSQPRVTIR